MNKIKNEVVKAIRMFDAMARSRTRKTLFVESLVILVMMFSIATPYAYASNFDFNSIFGSLHKIMTYLLLPVGIAWASWQIVYIAVVCGVIGIDPLNLLGGNLDQDHVWQEVRNRFRNFGYGIAWVAGVWILFELVLFLVGNLTGVISQAMGGK